MAEQLLKIPDVAALLNCSDSFAYNLVASDRLKHYRLGKGQGGVRVSRAQLDAFLQDREEGGEPPPAPLPAPKSPKKLRHLSLE